ncbi:MAG: hypothetical protein QOJ05_1005, partial [Verrucomicrobiota bacterium]
MVFDADRGFNPACDIDAERPDQSDRIRYIFGCQTACQDYAKIPVRFNKFTSNLPGKGPPASPKFAGASGIQHDRPSA